MVLLSSSVIRRGSGIVSKIYRGTGQIWTAGGSVDTLSTVDFTNIVRDLGPLGATYVGVGSSTYGRRPSTNTDQAAAELALDARFWRLPIRWNAAGGYIATSALGAGDFSVEADIDMYYNWGHRMVLVIAGQGGDFGTWTAGDATNIAQRLVSKGYDLSRFDFSSSNEPGLDGSVLAADKTREKITARAITIVNELRTVIPNVDLWGPVHYLYNRPELQDHMAEMGERHAGTNYHHYAMGDTWKTTDAAFRESVKYGEEVLELTNDAIARGVNTPVNLDEFNWAYRPDYNTPINEGGYTFTDGSLREGRLFRAENTVFMASTLGHIMKAGGRGMPYATQNKSLGVMVQNEYDGDTANLPEAGGVQQPDSTPMPAYWGIGAWTGAAVPGGTKPFPHMKQRFYNASVAPAVTAPAPTEVMLYAFDTTTQSWVGDGTSVSRSTTQVKDGAGSLALQKTGMATTGYHFLRGDDAAQNSALTSANGDTLKAWVYVPVGAPGTGYTARLEMQNLSYQWIAATDTPITPGVWTEISYTPSAELWAAHRGIAIQVGLNNPETSTVTVYVDSVRQTGATTGGNTDELTEVFAVDNEDGGYNLVVINKRDNVSRSIDISLTGLIGDWTMQRFRTIRNKPYDPYVSSEPSLITDNKVTLTLEPCTLSVLVLSPVSGFGKDYGNNYGGSV